MSAKRQATSDLNHDNWNEDEEPEDRGRFRTASQEEMKNRVIKKAKRKAAGSANDAGETQPTKSVFSGFSGFGKSSNTSGASSPFSFLSKLPTTENAAPKATFSFGSSSGSDEKPSTSTASVSFPFLSKISSATTTATITNTNATANFSFNIPNKPKTPEKTSTVTSSAFSFMPQTSVTAKGSTSDGSELNSKSPSTGGSLFASTSAIKPLSESKKSIFGGNVAQSTPANKSLDIKRDDPSTKSPEFYATIKRLNKDVAAWIQKHVNSDPICSLIPIFRDYEKYMKEIEEKDSNGSKPDIPKPTIPTISLSDDDDDDDEDEDGDEDSKNADKTKKMPTFKFSATVNETKKLEPSTQPNSLFSFNSSAQKSAFETSPSSEPKKPSLGTMNAPSTGLFGFGSKTDETKTPAPSSGATFSFGAKSNTEVLSGASKDLSKPVEASPTKPSVAPLSSNGFSFGLKPADKPATNPTGFTFGNGAGSSGTPAFSFIKNSEPFSFGNIKPPATNTLSVAKTDDAEDEEDTPPKVEFRQVVEDDAVYSKKCKVFVKKDGDFVERGVGTLYLKPVKDSKKTQLIVRADTNLGNILVNLILSSAIPCERKGKNNVLLVCLPTPEAEKPTPTLLRVKTGEEADQLLEMIKKYKN